MNHAESNIFSDIVKIKKIILQIKFSVEIKFFQKYLVSFRPIGVF